MKLLSATEAAKILPALHDRARKFRPGDVSRSKETWDDTFRDPRRHRHGGGGRIYVVHMGPDGDADGYATYRYQWKWQDGLPANSLSVEDIYSTSPEVDAGLWRFLLDIDLVEEVTAGARPLDEPLRWRLADPRRLRTTSINDALWARLVDIPAALSLAGIAPRQSWCSRWRAQ